MTAATIDGDDVRAAERRERQLVAATVTYNAATLHRHADPTADLAVAARPTRRRSTAAPPIRASRTPPATPSPRASSWSFTTATAASAARARIWPATGHAGDAGLQRRAAPSRSASSSRPIGTARSRASASTRARATPARTSAVSGPRAGTLLGIGDLHERDGDRLAAGGASRRRSRSPPTRRYVVSYYAPNGHYAVDAALLQHGRRQRAAPRARRTRRAPMACFAYSATLERSRRSRSTPATTGWTSCSTGRRDTDAADRQHARRRHRARRASRHPRRSPPTFSEARGSRRRSTRRDVRAADTRRTRWSPRP